MADDGNDSDPATSSEYGSFENEYSLVNRTGNRLTAEEDGTATVYTSSDLNQYTRVNTEEPSYDADGNMLTWNGWSYTWNDENRLVAAEKGALRFEADYDYMSRRFEKKIRRDGVLTKYEKYVYDGYKLIAIYDALNDNALQAAFTWQPIGLDVPLTMTYREETFYYVTDGNKNVVAMTDSSGNHITEYTYAPFGRLLHMEGELAEINPFRFSSEFHDNETGLVYYNYRYYSPELGRWVKRDPIEEKGDVNLYAMVGNEPINYWDFNGKTKLNIKLISTYFYRFLRASSLPGIIYNWFKDDYKFFDEEQELVKTLEQQIHAQLVKSAREQGLRFEWHRQPLYRVNIGPLKMRSSGLGSAGYLLSAASNIYIEGIYCVQMQGGNINFRRFG